MSLPLNINQLIHGKAIEWDRLEFKQGWNPEDVLHTLCAFANDINNWGGGYIIVGVAEADGRPVLPPEGIPEKQLDKIQKDLISLCHKIEPFFAPVSMPVLFQERYIFVIWVPGGDNRPYKTFASLGKKDLKHYYVRRGTVSKSANAVEERQLLEQAAKIPFDDRINHHAEIKDFDLSLIQAFLQQVGSSLYEESKQISLEELCRQMRIASGPDEYLRPLNAGLLFFSAHPETYFAGATTDVVQFKDDVGKEFTEKRFTGPIHNQLRGILEFIRNNVITEQVRKRHGRAEADRFFN